MLKTCANCRFYHSTLSESGSHFHIHNYCDKFGKLETFLYSSQELSFLKWYEDTYRQYNFLGFTHDDAPIYDDVETGSAVCWLFKAKDKTSDDEDANMLDYKKSNLHKAIALIDALLDHEIVCEAPDFKIERIKDADRNYLNTLKEKFTLQLKELEKDAI